MVSTEPFRKQRVKYMVRSAREDTESRETQQGERKSSMPGFYYRRVFRGSEVLG